MCCFSRPRSSPAYLAYLHTPQDGRMARQQAAVLLPLLLLLLLLALYSVAALHEDRAGKEDWLKQHVGRVIKAAPTVRRACEERTGGWTWGNRSQAVSKNRSIIRVDRFDLPEPTPALPTQTNTTQRHAVVVASEQGAIAGLSLQNGDIQWRHVFPSSSASHPIVDLVVEEAKGLVLVLSR